MIQYERCIFALSLSPSPYDLDIRSARMRLLNKKMNAHSSFSINNTIVNLEWKSNFQSFELENVFTSLSLSRSLRSNLVSSFSSCLETYFAFRSDQCFSSDYLLILDVFFPSFFILEKKIKRNQPIAFDHTSANFLLLVDSTLIFVSFLFFFA